MMKSSWNLAQIKLESRSNSHINCLSKSSNLCTALWQNGAFVAFSKLSLPKLFGKLGKKSIFSGPWAYILN